MNREYRVLISRIPKKVVLRRPKPVLLRRSPTVLEEKQIAQVPSEIKINSEKEEYKSWLCSSSEEENARDLKKNKKKCQRINYSKKTKYDDIEMGRKRQRSTEMGDEFQSENPFFTIVLQILGELI